MKVMEMNMSPYETGAEGIPPMPRLAKITSDTNSPSLIPEGPRTTPVPEVTNSPVLEVSEQTTLSSDEVLTEEISVAVDTDNQSSFDTAEIPPPISQATREIADGIKLAFEELRPIIKDFIQEVYEEMTGKKPEKSVPDIEYNERQHWLKFAFQLLIPIFLFVVATAMYVWLTGRLFATIPAVLILAILLWFGVRYLARKQKNSVKSEKKKRYTLFAMFGLAVVTLLLCSGISLILALLGVSFVWSLVYLVGCAVSIYYSYRLHYMWSQLWFTRDGGVIHASRPEKTIYFLPTFNKDLFLENVNDANDAQSWIEEGLGIYRIHISLDAEMPDKKEDPLGYQNAKFWRRLSFIVNGAQLRAAIKQGAQYRRR